ncbi:hypothetical protein EYF80_067518 [Liparis tanakae]|uniref:Uncharacterized protein n=1 Tax=Liparis tanakae TaxID=230148 RepID=A0A4Z2E0Y0_9TELE|nr:hypothetical protein EYF80_067518 [Liparis tanakae]
MRPRPARPGPARVWTPPSVSSAVEKHSLTLPWRPGVKRGGRGPPRRQSPAWSRRRGGSV